MGTSPSPIWSRKSRWGAACMVLSWPVWLAVLAVPLLPLELSQKVVLAAAEAAVSYALWFGGLTLAGPELAARFRFSLRAWWRGRRDS